MRNPWWMLPVAVVLILAGVAGGLLLARPRADRAGAGDQVYTPPLPGEQQVAKPVGPAPVQSKPQSPAPTQEPAPKPEPKRPPDAEALTFMHQFMQARMAGDSSKLASFIAPDAPGRAGIRVSSPGSYMTGFHLDLLGSGDADSFIFRAKVAFTVAQPGNEVASEYLRVSWKGGFKVAAFEERPDESLAVGVDKEGRLQVHRGQATALAADLALLPAEHRPWGAGVGSAFEVGKDGWAVAAVSPAGSHVLWVTRGQRPLLGVSQLDWGGAPAITPLGLLSAGGAVDAAWSPVGSRYVAVTVSHPAGGTGLIVYDLSGSQSIAPDLGTVTGTEGYTVKNVRWLAGGTSVVFDLVQAGNTTGPWVYNVSAGLLSAP